MLNLRCIAGRTWKLLFGFLLPFLFLPLLILCDTQESRCGYVILLMASYWMLEPIPLAATSLMPIVLFPLLGVLSTSEASLPYMNSTNMMFVGGLMMAVAIEHSNLHKRIALNVLVRIDPTASKMMLGFMTTAMVLSMWISNTATAALMVPIIDAVLSEIEEKNRSSEIQRSKSNEIQLKSISVISSDIKVSPMTFKEDEPSSLPCKNGELTLTVQPPSPDVENNNEERAAAKDRSSSSSSLRRAMFLSIAYSTNIGGTGTITGTGPNLVVKGLMEELFPESEDLSFDKWMMYNVPVMLICVFIAWIYLLFVYIRKVVPKYSKDMKKSFKQIIQKKHEELGNMTFQEKAVSILFGILVLLWIFRDPHFIRGWGSYFPKKVRDATPAIGVPLLLFLIPAQPWRPSKSPPLLDWKTLQAKLPWGIILLLGGGFSLAEGAKKSGLTVWASEQLASLNISSPVAVVSVLCLLTAALTEFTSNVATANVLLPVVAQLAVATKVHPIYYVLPVTIACSFAFMLPVATPPNAIVFDAGNMRTMDMVKPGLFMNIVCVAVEVAMINSLGSVIFNFSEFPSWANNNFVNNSTNT